MIAIIDWIPSLFLVVIFFLSVVSSVLYTILKCHTDGPHRIQHKLGRYIIVIVASISSLALGAKMMRDCWIDDNKRLNNQLKDVMNKTDKVNTEIVVQEVEKEKLRTEQKIKVLTKVEKIKSNDFKDYYGVINEASKNPNR